jgi:hypothetical protein
MVLAPARDSDFTARTGLPPVDVILTPQLYELIQTLYESLNRTQHRLSSSAALGGWGHNRDREYLRVGGRRGSPIEVANKSPRQSISHRERAPKREGARGGKMSCPWPCSHSSSRSMLSRSSALLRRRGTEQRTCRLPHVDITPAFSCAGSISLHETWS